MPKFNTLFLSCAAALSLPAVADDIKNYQSFSGYTGLINIPNAEVEQSGSANVGFNNQLDLRGVKYVDGYNYIFAAGLIEGLEVSGQIASSTMNDNMFANAENRKQLRDLSFNAKYQIPYIPKDWFSVAIGAKDLGGASNKYETYYVVASKELWDFRLSAGVGTNEKLTGKMDGAFAGVEWQPLEWFSLLTEYDAEAVNAAARITVPKKWLFDIGELTFTSRFYSSTDFSEDKDSYWGVNFSLPLSDEAKSNYKSVKPGPYVEPINTKPVAKINDHGFGFFQASMAPELAKQPEALTTANVEHAPNELANTSLSGHVEQLKEALIGDGFENVVVGFTTSTVFVNFENSVFNRNDIDAIGVVLGRITEYVNVENKHFSVQLAKSDLPLIAIKGSIDNYRAFIERGNSPDLNIMQGRVSIPEGVVWAGKAEASPYFKPRLTVNPVLSSTYATEFGVFDYSVGVRATLDIPLWKGAGINVAAQTIVEESDDFEDRKVFDNYSLDEGIVNASLYQTFALPYGFYNQTQIGFYKDYFDFKAIINNTAWLSPEGRHKLSAKIAYYDFADYRASREYETLSLDYNGVEQDITLHASGGNYFYGDSGYKLESRFWYGDSYVGIFYQETDSQKVGVAINIPLTPRKDMNVTRFGQLKGKSAWRTSVSTRVGNDINTLIFNEGYAPTSSITLDNTVFNKGRLNSSYIYSNLARMKEAYESYK